MSAVRGADMLPSMNYAIFMNILIHSCGIVVVQGPKLLQQLLVQSKVMMMVHLNQNQQMNPVWDYRMMHHGNVRHVIVMNREKKNTR